MSKKRKRKIKLMILTALILLIPIKVNALELEPTWVQTIGYNSNNQETRADVGALLYNIYNQNWYGNGVSGQFYGIAKIGIRYNLSNVNYDYLTFTIMGPIQEGSAKLGGNVCEIQQINNSVTNGQFNNNFVMGLICRNPKLSDSWLDINILRQTNGTVGSIYINQNVGAYNNETAAQIAIQTTQDSTYWNNFNNADISQQTQQPVDDSGIQNVEQQEQAQVDQIEQALNNLTPQQFDLTDFSLTFAWIWQTIIYLFTTHSILMSTMIIVLSLGFIKTVFGR